MMPTPPKPPPQPLQAHSNPWGEHHPRDTQLQGPTSIPHQGVPPPPSIISHTPPGAASTRHAATPLACLLPSAAVVKKLNFHLFSHPCLSRCRRFPRSIAPGSPRSRLRMIQWGLGDAEFIFPLLFSTCFCNPSREVGASGVTPPAFVPPSSHGQRWGGFGKKREKTVTGVQTTPCVPRVQDPADSHPGVSPPGPHAQHWLQDGVSPPRRASRASAVPVGVGGVTMMEGTCRCLSPGASGVLSLPFPLLTHVFKPVEIWGTQKHNHVWGVQHQPPPCPAQPLMSH